jgi:integrase
MASIAKDKNGRKRILFFNQDGERKVLRIGKETMGNARTIATRIEFLVAAKRNGTVPEPDTIGWLASIGDDFHTKLADHGLVAPRAKAANITLRAFLDGYIARRSDVKRGTAIVYGHTRRCLVKYFGPDKPLSEITVADAKDWRRWLAQSKNVVEEKGGQGLSDNTVRRRCGIARQFFNDAVERRLIAENPFAKMKGVAVRANKSRYYFVSRDEAQAVLDTCPNDQWKLLFALSRYGGLRCPSEHLALRWGDIDWEGGRITIRSPKTEHHEGKGERVIPLFTELRPHLQAVLDELLEDFDPKEMRLSEQPVIT